MTTEKSKKTEKTPSKREPFDSSKDECLSQLGEVNEGDQIIRVCVYSYDGGPKKIGMTRHFKTKNGDEKIGKLGRIELGTAQAIAKIITKANL